MFVWQIIYYNSDACIFIYIWQSLPSTSSRHCFDPLVNSPNRLNLTCQSWNTSLSTHQSFDTSDHQAFRMQFAIPCQTLSDHCPVWQSLRQAVWRVSSFTTKYQIFFHSHLVDQQDHFPRKHCLPAVTTGPELQQWLQWRGWFDLCQGQCWCHGCMPNLVQQECDKCEPTWDSASSESESHCLSLFSSDAL